MNQIRAVTLRNLDKQGFDGLDNAAKSRQAWPLRFTPAVSVSLIVIGLALQSPWWLAGMALVALSGALLPGGMLIDTLYNIGVRHLFRAPPLPPTPKPRQFSYLVSTAFLSASAVLFYAGLPVLGSVVGGLVAIAGTVLATTHWCLGSFYYRLILRAADSFAARSELRGVDLHLPVGALLRTRVFVRRTAVYDLCGCDQARHRQRLRHAKAHDPGQDPNESKRVIEVLLACLGRTRHATIHEDDIR